MVQLGYVGLAVLIGSGLATQVAMIGAMTRWRGPVEAAWTSLAATVVGFALVLGYRAVRAGPITLPTPFEKPLLWVAVFAVSLTALVLVARGIAPYFALTGLFAIPFLLGAAFLAPRLGIALYLSAAISGQLVASVMLDHFGAFGAQAHRIDSLRLTGVAALIVGVVLIRGIRT